jgi:hypothetical protein
MNLIPTTAKKPGSSCLILFPETYTDKKENKTFLIYKEIQMGSVAKSYKYEEGLPNI